MEPGDKTITVLDAQTPKRLKLMPDGTYAEVVVVQFTMDATEHAAEHRTLAAAGTLITNAELSAQLAGLGGVSRPATYAAITRGVAFKTQPREAAPTFALNLSALASSQTVLAISAGVLNKKFGFSGCNPANLAIRASAYPQYNVVMAVNASADTVGATRFSTSFYYIGAGTFDIIRYGDASGVDVFVDDVYAGSFLPALVTGTAQAGTSTTITLAAGSSATNGYYNQHYVRITGGTGAGQIRQITGYVGSTKIASVDAAWSTTPDATSTYSVDQSASGIALDGNTGSLKYLNCTLPGSVPAQPTARKITVIGSSFYGVNIGQNDTIWAAEPAAQMTLMVVGDSYWDGTSGPLNGPILAQQLALRMGLQLVNLSSGSTGLWVRGQNNRLNFLNRIVPPAEAWEFKPPYINGATAGTYTISITYNGVTSTTSALAYNANNAAIEMALNALTFAGFSASTGVSWVGPTGQGCFCVARGDYTSNFIVIANGMIGATISINNSGLTGGVAGVPFQYVGDVAKNIPVDGNGNAVPFILLIPGSGNDVAATGFTTSALQANAVTLANAIATRFPTAIPVFTGIITNSVGTSGNGVIQASDVACNTALSAGAALLPKISGQIAFIDTYTAGVGGLAWFDGSGTVAAPTNGTRDFMKSITVTGHPTGLGAAYLAGRIAANLLALFRGASLPG